ncbi:MAG: RluA family pseudouridine synthase, partial [Tannerellaceae bacterium]
NVTKRYTAILDGAISLQAGIIDLPICLDPTDRPRQMVNHELGKNAVTKYEVLSCENNATRIAFYPITGRTHQLRVHAAHVEGLNTPIKGDELYGKKSDRLYLHAEYLEFTHPITQQRIIIEAKAPF